MTRSAHRREGFVGQHLIVVPPPLWRSAQRHPLLGGLCVTDAGYFPTAAKHLVERAAGAPTTLIILCLSGSGWVRVGAERAEIAAGGLAWLPANVPHAYGAADRDPWTIVWVHFTGGETVAWRDALGLPPTRLAPLQLPDDRLDEVGLDRVYAALEQGFAVKHLIAAAAALRNALSQTMQIATMPRGARSAHERVAASVEMLRGNWLRSHRLEELATAAKVSTTHYSLLFREQTGFSPIDFLIRLRVQHACRLLDTTSLPVAEVAERVGYEDPYYFARCFRRVMGQSPRRYRGVTKG